MSAVGPLAPHAGDVGTVPASEPLLERRGFDSYAVSVGGSVVGFVDVVGRIYVVSQGCRYDRAVEIAQVLDLSTAVRRLVSVL